MLFTNMCERFIRLCYGEFGFRLFLGFFVSSLCFVHSGCNWLGLLPLVVFRAWVLLVCLFSVTFLGRWPFGVLPA